MLPKYKIDYAIEFRNHEHHHHYQTDDPVTCEQFLAELLERGLVIKGVIHEGVPLPQVDFDRMIRTAAGILASRRICQSLRIDSVEAHRRFGLPA